MFSWENNIDHQQAIDSAISKLGNTEILVIIGYSFPFFNREIDLKIFNGLRNLKKVYYQVKDANKEILVERFGFNNVRFNPSSINAIQTKEISFYDQFHIPEEF
jgi:D-ribose pyranose/furanose isomerase RbsD